MVYAYVRCQNVGLHFITLAFLVIFNDDVSSSWQEDKITDRELINKMWFVWFHNESSDDEDSGRPGINKMLQRKAVKKRDMQQVQQSMTEGPAVHEFDEVYESMTRYRGQEEEAVTAKLGMDKNS